MPDNGDYEWKFWLWTFITAIIILVIALFCKIFIVMGGILGIGGIIVAIYGWYYDEENTFKGGVISEFLGLFMLILGNTIYNFLQEKGLIAFAQEVLKIILFIR